MNDTRVSREEIVLLRLGAQAIIREGVREPYRSWAHGLLKFAERLVIESGLPAGYFGNCVEMRGEEAFQDECCAACGGWGGSHDGWCMYDEQASEPAASSEQPVRRWGKWPPAARGLEQGAEPEPSADLESMLTWLDLSGLPPVPPAEPPARKPTDWHFDAPDGRTV